MRCAAPPRARRPGPPRSPAALWPRRRTSAAASGEDTRSTLSWDNSGDDSITRFQYRYRISSVNAGNPDWTDIPGSGCEHHVLQSCGAW